MNFLDWINFVVSHSLSSIHTFTFCSPGRVQFKITTFLFLVLVKKKSSIWQNVGRFEHPHFGLLMRTEYFSKALSKVFSGETEKLNLFC